MRLRVIAALLLVAAACTRAAVDDPAAERPATSDASSPEPAGLDAGAIVEAAASDASTPKTCADLPAYVCDFSIGSCNPLDAILGGGPGTSQPSFPSDAGIDGSHAFRAHVENGGQAAYIAGFSVDFDGGARGCNVVCDVDLKVEAADPGAGLTVLYGMPDFTTKPARLELTDAGWVHTGDDPPGAQTAPLDGQWFHARLAMNRLPMDAGSTSTLTLSFADASTTTTQTAKEMPIGLAVGARGAAGVSATTTVDNIVCRAVD